jgi:hypothetical protein
MQLDPYQVVLCNVCNVGIEYKWSGLFYAKMETFMSRFEPLNHVGRN